MADRAWNSLPPESGGKGEVPKTQWEESAFGQDGGEGLWPSRPGRGLGSYRDSTLPVRNGIFRLSQEQTLHFFSTLISAWPESAWV